MGWIALLALVPGLYALHRFCLYLEAQGYLYYKHKRSSSSSMSAFHAMQQVIEPSVEHTICAEDEQLAGANDEAGDPLKPHRRNQFGMPKPPR